MGQIVRGFRPGDGEIVGVPFGREPIRTQTVVHLLGEDVPGATQCHADSVFDLVGGVAVEYIDPAERNRGFADAEVNDGPTRLAYVMLSSAETTQTDSSSSVAAVSRRYTRPMAFNIQLAQELLQRRDRDTAPFFAGRQDEIRKFDAALRESEHGGEQAVFRIYQGAPGCGKTSLVDRLRRIRSEGVVFVDIRKRHLVSEDALVDRVRDALADAGSTGTRIAATVLRAIGSRLRVQPVGDALGEVIVDKTVGRTKVALHMDEAQLIDHNEQPGLVRLHVYGLGVPTVCLFTGLSHTADRIGGIEGLSRLASNAVVNMGAMSEEECAESTSMMLDKLGVVGAKPEAAQMVAALSHGWPQHLHGAQTALCRELLRTQGVLRDVNATEVRRESDRRRHEYYDKRLAGSVLGEWPALTAGVIARVRAERPATQPALTKVCRNELERQGLNNDPDFEVTPKEFAASLVERGVLSLTPGRRYDVAIPSMAQWLGRLSG